MPRPRFLKLPEERRRSILERASEEFVEHGYRGASLNRFLEAASLSKGAFYYYFDDRDDLYGAVLERELNFGSIPQELRAASSVTEYYRAMESWLDELYENFLGSKAGMSLARDLANTMGSQGPPPAVAEMMQACYEGTALVLEVGQKLGAVRTDLPQDLLAALVMKLGEGVDLWTAEHLDEVSAESPVKMRSLVVELFQRLVSPTGVSAPTE